MKLNFILSSIFIFKKLAFLRKNCFKSYVERLEIINRDNHFAVPIPQVLSKDGYLRTGKSLQVFKRVMCTENKR